MAIGNPKTGVTASDLEGIVRAADDEKLSQIYNNPDLISGVHIPQSITLPEMSSRLHHRKAAEAAAQPKPAPGPVSDRVAEEFNQQFQGLRSLSEGTPDPMAQQMGQQLGEGLALGGGGPQQPGPPQEMPPQGMPPQGPPPGPPQAMASGGVVGLSNGGDTDMIVNMMKDQEMARNIPGFAERYRGLDPDKLSQIRSDYMDTTLLPQYRTPDHFSTYNPRSSGITSLSNYDDGGMGSSIGRFFTGAGSFREAADNPFRTAMHMGMMVFPAGLGGLALKGAGKLALRGLAKYSNPLAIARMAGKPGLRGKFGRWYGGQGNIFDKTGRIRSTPIENWPLNKSGLPYNPVTGHVIKGGRKGGPAIRRSGGNLKYGLDDVAKSMRNRALIYGGGAGTMATSMMLYPDQEGTMPPGSLQGPLSADLLWGDDRITAEAALPSAALQGDMSKIITGTAARRKAAMRDYELYLGTETPEEEGLRKFQEGMSTEMKGRAGEIEGRVDLDRDRGEGIASLAGAAAKSILGAGQGMGAIPLIEEIDKQRNLGREQRAFNERTMDAAYAMKDRGFGFDALPLEAAATRSRARTITEPLIDQIEADYQNQMANLDLAMISADTQTKTAMIGAMAQLNAAKMALAQANQVSPAEGEAFLAYIYDVASSLPKDIQEQWISQEKLSFYNLMQNKMRLTEMAGQSLLAE